MKSSLDTSDRGGLGELEPKGIMTEPAEAGRKGRGAHMSRLYSRRISPKYWRSRMVARCSLKLGVLTRSIPLPR